MDDDDEIQAIAHVNQDQTVYTYVIKSAAGRKLTNAEVILELEYLINEMARADDQMSQPGVARH